MRYILPILAMALLAPWTPELDLTVSNWFYTPQGFSKNPIFSFIFTFAPWPSILLIIASAFAFVFKPTWRKPAACLFLTGVVGIVLIVNVMFKDHWGRPRPKQVTEFGGVNAFRPFYSPDFLWKQPPDALRSFPCGHCSTGFYFFSLILVGKRLHNRRLYMLGIATTVILGILLSITRIAQGGHFLSDALMTALIMWLTALLIDRLVYHDAAPA